mgnify:FL=1
MQVENPIQELYTSKEEQKVRNDMWLMLQMCPIPPESLLPNIGLFLNSKNLSRILMMDFLYRQIINTHGVIMEFGTRWGQNIALFAALRGIYEPFNRHRKIIGFDTFTGFPSIDKKDNATAPFAYNGGLTTTPEYENFLDGIMNLQERDNPINHIKKYEIVKGDASKTIHPYLESHIETIVSLAYFDFDIYRPTIDCLRAIWDRCVKGTVIVFDELCDSDSPGETTAFVEAMRSFTGKVRLQRSQFTSRISYFVVE